MTRLKSACGPSHREDEVSEPLGWLPFLAAESVVKYGCVTTRTFLPVASDRAMESNRDLQKAAHVAVHPPREVASSFGLESDVALPTVLSLTNGGANRGWDVHPRWKPALVSKPKHAIERNTRGENFGPQLAGAAE